MNLGQAYHTIFLDWIVALQGKVPRHRCVSCFGFTSKLVYLEFIPNPGMEHRFHEVKGEEKICEECWYSCWLPVLNRFHNKALEGMN